ncbi:MAG: hypothetical protein QXL01_04445 [Thermoplasmatales archaeon]
MKNYLISEEIRNALLQYLLNRPMIEVELGVQALRNLPEVTDSPEESSKQFAKIVEDLKNIKGSDTEE